MAGFGRDMAGERMAERIGMQPRERRHRGGRDEAVEQDRDAAPPRRQRRAQDGGELAAAQRRRDPQRIVEHRGVARERAVDHGLLAGEAGLVDAGAAAGPARAAAAEQRRRDRRRRGGVADAHLAETDEVGLRRDRVVAGRDRGQERGLVHGRRLR